MLRAVAAEYRVSVKDVVEGPHKPSGATVYDVGLVVSKEPIGILALRISRSPSALSPEKAPAGNVATRCWIDPSRLTRSKTAAASDRQSTYLMIP